MSEHPMPVGQKLTVDELWAIFPDEDGLRHELIDSSGLVFASIGSWKGL